VTVLLFHVCAVMYSVCILGAPIHPQDGCVLRCVIQLLLMLRIAETVLSWQL
jgi:hypothetical protein